MRLIDADAFDTVLKNGEIEANKQRKYVLASALNTIRGNLRNFPSAQSEQSDGEWVITIEDSTYIVRCSKCGCKPLLNRYNHATEKSNFCPYCGADMRGDSK